MRRSRQWNFTLGGEVTVAVGQAIGFVGFVDEVEVVRTSIGMRGSVRERGRALVVMVVSCCAESWEEGGGYLSASSRI